MTWHTWAIFAATETALCLSPGPAVLFVVAQALRYGGRQSLWANLGILSANAFYFLLSAIGLGAVLFTSHNLFLGIKYAGAVYLIFLGVSTFLGRGIAFPTLPALADSEPPGRRMLGRAFLLQAANPKALLFFSALLPQFIRPDQPIAVQVLILALTSFVVELLVLAGYGFLAGGLTEFAGRQRFLRNLNRVTGGLLVGAGAGLALAGDR